MSAETSQPPRSRPALTNRANRKSPTAYRTISEVSDELHVPQHVLRFWESKFSQVRPLKRAGGRRYYRPEDIDLLNRIRSYLYDEGYTIKGVQKLLKEGVAKSETADGHAAPNGTVVGAAGVSSSSHIEYPVGPPAASVSASGGLSANTRADLESLLSSLKALRAGLRGE